MQVPSLDWPSGFWFNVVDGGWDLASNWLAGGLWIFAAVFVAIIILGGILSAVIGAVKRGAE